MIFWTLLWCEACDIIIATVLIQALLLYLMLAQGTPSSVQLQSIIADFSKAASASADAEGMLPRSWSEEDWLNMFRFVAFRQVKSGEALVRGGDADRTLYFVLKGRLEIIIPSAHGMSLGAVNRVGVGSVLGEASFFDGKGRTASAWAVSDCEVAAMAFEQYLEFERLYPQQARDLLFAMGKVLASRLRRATARIAL